MLFLKLWKFWEYVGLWFLKPAVGAEFGIESCYCLKGAEGHRQKRERPASDVIGLAGPSEVGRP